MLNTPQLLVGTPTKLSQAALTGTPATLYTVPANQRAAIYDINICNTTAGVLTCTVLAGAAATASNAIFYGSTIPANGLVQWTGFQVLNSADVITGYGSAVGLTITISGMESV